MTLRPRGAACAVTLRGGALAAAALLAACSSGPPSVGARFAGPSAIVPFRGLTPKVRGAVHDYLAVASSRGDELRLIDPADEQPVLGPGFVFPLSVVTAPRPLLLGAAPLGDGQTDLLVAVSAGGALHSLPTDASQGPPALQVVDTWSGAPRVAYDVSLAPLVGPDAEILTVRGLPSPAAGQARLVAGVSGGRLVLVQFQRGADGLSIEPAAADHLTATALLGFDAADIAPAPDGPRIFVATRDPIPAAGGAIRGVAVIDTTGTAQSWIATGLDARAGTVAVAAARVPERAVGAGSAQAETFQFPAQGQAAPLSVYAILDRGTCGPQGAINCGVVTLRPDQSPPGLAPDPAVDAVAAAPAGAPPSLPAQKYRAPIPVPGFPVSIAVGFPTASGSITDDPQNPNQPLIRLEPVSGLRNTPAIAMVTASDGQVYWLDLARFGPVSDQTLVRGAGRTRALSASAAVPLASAYGPGLHNDAQIAEAQLAQLDDGTVVVPAPAVVTDAVNLPLAVETWPGFTPDETFSVLFQAALPGLAQAGAVYSPGPDGVYVGAQTLAIGDGVVAPVVVLARIGDPELGARPGDLADVCLGTSCATATSCTTTVAAVLAPGDPQLAPSSFPAPFPGFPGGALRLAPASCLATVSGPETVGQITVRAAGWVVSGAALGHLGRPVLDQTFTLGSADETGLTGEALVIARKTRRLFYPTEGACPAAGGTGQRSQLPVGCAPGFPGLYDPLQPGPVLRFRLGLNDPAAPDGNTPPVRQPSAGTGLTISTQRGLVATARRPAVGGVLPAGILAVDRTKVASGPASDPIRFYVPYSDDQVMVFSPSEATSGVTGIR